MNELIVTRIVPLAAVVAGLAAVAGIASHSTPVRLSDGVGATPPRAVSVSTAVRACPAPGIRGTGFPQLAVVAAPGGHGPGQAQVTELGTGGNAAAVNVTQPGALTVASLKTVRAAGQPAAPSGQAVPTGQTPGGVVINASGSMAPGLEAEQVNTDGTVSARCAGPGTGFWFTGPGMDSVRHFWLYLMNVGSQPAVADVEAFTDEGPVLGTRDTGIAVAPHAMLVQSLDTMLRDSHAVALFVSTNVGQVVAAAEEGSNGAASGAWLPAAVPPAQRIVIPGLPGALGTPQVFVAVPGSRDAHLTLTAITAKGAYEPTGGSGLDIPADSAFGVSLPSLAGTAGALQISSTVPITASVVSPGGPLGTPGVFTAAAGPLAEQGVVADNVSAGGNGAQLILAAPGRAVRVRITETGGTTGKASSPQTVLVPAHSAVVSQLIPPPGAKRSTVFAVTVAPLAGSGPLYAARVLAAGRSGRTLESILPITSAPVTVTLGEVTSGVLTASP